ncbi:RNA demethylase ALKBH9B-like [Gastrolobium bilobum]|uniref:RNA demethylase ALKBH9B-like n=1 Tax=Gastrolobium bilobum TaxID=150636 RepID=UPI002AB07318|nr:RNA demethylase ALKBH9B-like [Gastrolobium bilobum]
MNVRRKKDFICFERVHGKLVNILKGLELHMGIFSAAEQKRIVSYVASLQEMGRKGELKDRTFTAPKKWMRGKGRETIQFGCCYNYAVDRDGNPPGILPRGSVDPIPDLFKVIIRRLIKWHVLPPTCVPDSCIVNIYEEGDCIPPHIDSHDFLRPFCTVSFLSECNIVFGSNLKIVGPGEFDGSFTIPLPLGSVLVLNGNGADVAKHCVPAVPMRRISITFRKMDPSKRPFGYVPEPDLQDIQPLVYEVDKEMKSSGPTPNRHKRHRDTRGGRTDAMGYATRRDRFVGASHVTNVISGSDYPTTNLYLTEVYRVKEVIYAAIEDNDDFMREMARPMKVKFDKYWGECNLLMAITSVLDPMCKLHVVNICIPIIYKSEVEARENVEKVKQALEDLYNEYCALGLQEPVSNSELETTVNQSSLSSTIHLKVLNLDFLKS